MAAHPAAHPVLRLVPAEGGRGDGGPQRVSRAAHAPSAAARAVGRENLAAATLPAADARRIFSLSVSGALEGGRAALLTPEKRRRLVAAAARLGLRPFDANLIIAIVQDAARRGGAADAGDPRLALVRGGAGSGRRRRAALLAAAVGLGAALAAAMASWVVRG